METNLKMQGELEPGLLMDLLQVMNRRHSLNGYVDVAASSVAGRIWLHEGAIIAANWKDREGELAVECMLRLKQGVFEVGEATVLPARTIFKDTVALLMVCMRSIGRDALNPVVPTRNSRSQQIQKVAVPEPVMSLPVNLANRADEPMPAPACLPVDRPRKRGRVLAGRWSWRLGIALLVLALTGIGVRMGLKFHAENKEAVVVSQVPVVVPPPAPVVVAVPLKTMPVLQDGWPDIMLSALAASGKRHYCAILNGQLLGIGEQVDGVTLRSIRANGVVLEYQGKRRFLCSAQLK